MTPPLICQCKGLMMMRYPAVTVVTAVTASTILSPPACWMVRHHYHPALYKDFCFVFILQSEIAVVICNLLTPFNPLL